MTASELFAELGGFDERFFMFVEDVDYCWRTLLRGGDVRVVPEAVARHYGGASAPDGYVTANGLATTRFRVLLRERNTLAALLKCYASPTLAAVLPAYAAQSLATATALAAAGRRHTAIGILGRPLVERPGAAADADVAAPGSALEDARRARSPTTDAPRTSEADATAPVWHAPSRPGRARGAPRPRIEHAASLTERRDLSRWVGRPGGELGTPDPPYCGGGVGRRPALSRNYDSVELGYGLHDPSPGPPTRLDEAADVLPR